MKNIVFLLFFILNRISASSFDNIFEKGKPFNGTIWALLVAGSNEWYNYRHQADICHAYQVLHKHGIPDEKIIVMMYDDIANNSQNPKPGFIRNKPGGPNVYPGVPKDYTNSEVTPENFLAALSGNEQLRAQGKKVIQSGPNDHIFVYFSDHGAPGIVAFPSSELKATDLNDVIKKMYSDKKYNKMVFYIEACESGSMFDGLLPKNINVFSTTAANSEESSYACYYDEEMKTYLGDVYSVKWLEDSDKASFTSETLQQQFKNVKKETNTSHVQEFGDLSIGKLTLSEFQGEKKVFNEPNTFKSIEIIDAVPGPDVPLILAAKKAQKQRSNEMASMYQREYESMLVARAFMNDSVSKIVEKITPFVDASFEVLWNTKLPLKQHKCYEKMYSAFDAHCFDLSTHPFALRFLYVFVNFCHYAKDDWYTIAMARNAMARFCFEEMKGKHITRIL
ncbi:legumain-like protein [Leptotrombidium deliense]|uniref:legumain n=1 Tax=Leptotrombidium deliense TaxID=299467 RepID=A0A443SUC0_9ACAR|nr:legumain-like protein [Leptotrombidium deliense]